MTLASTAVAVGSNPFGVVESSTATFVATSSSVVILDHLRRIVAHVAVPGAAALFGEALSPDGKALFVADGSGVAVIDIATQRLVGRLSAGNEQGTIEVAVSPESRFLAATEESAGLVTIFDLTSRTLVTQIPVDPLPVGVAFTPDGRALLVTSEQNRRVPSSTTERPGTLQVIDTKTWKVHDSVPAGCSPVRVAVSPTGQTWVTARGSNAVLEFDTNRLVRGAPRPLLGWVRVGPAPVGVVVANDGKEVVVANSNRFVAPVAPSTLSVIQVARPHRQPAVTRTFTTEGFPRDLAVAPSGRTVVSSCYGGGTVDFVALSP